MLPAFTTRTRTVTLIQSKGGDDLDDADINEGFGDDMVVADDRDVQVSLGMSSAWLTLDNLLANFVDPINADRGSLVSLFSETSRMANQQRMELSWRWSWCSTEQQQIMDKIRSLKEAKEAANPEDANKADGEESTVEGRSKRQSLRCQHLQQKQ